MKTKVDQHTSVLTDSVINKSAFVLPLRQCYVGMSSDLSGPIYLISSMPRIKLLPVISGIHRYQVDFVQKGLQ